MRAILLIALLTVLVALPSPVSASSTADLKIDVSGTDTGGDTTSIACDLNFVAIPSNFFEGSCRVSVGIDQLTVVGGGTDRQQLPTVVLNGQINIRGIAQSGTGRFSAVSDQGRSGFPLDIRIDPLGRTWLIRTDAPSGDTGTIASGQVTSGSLALGLR